MPCFTQLLTLVRRWFHVSLVPIHPTHPLLTSSHDLFFIETYEIEDPFPHLDPYA